MKSLILMALVVVAVGATVTLFANSRISMTKFDLKILNDVLAAMYTGEVKLFAENASFDSISAHYSPDGKTARFDIRGEMTMKENINCGELRLSLKRLTHSADESTWNTYTAVLDTSHLAPYCVLSYKDAKR